MSARPFFFARRTAYTVVMRLFLCLGLLLASACDRSEPVPTATENRDLDEAGTLLDGAQDNLAAIDNSGLEPANDTAP